jgi:hypothetical protein
MAISSTPQSLVGFLLKQSRTRIAHHICLVSSVSFLVPLDLRPKTSAEYMEKEVEISSLSGDPDCAARAELEFRTGTFHAALLYCTSATHASKCR